MILDRQKQKYFHSTRLVEDFSKEISLRDYPKFVTFIIKGLFHFLIVSARKSN